MGNPNMFITGKIPVQGQDDYGKDETFALHAKRRVAIEYFLPAQPVNARALNA